MERVKREIEEVIGIDCSHAICASAKQVLTGTREGITCLYYCGLN